MRTLSLPKNTQGRDFVVGDVHGHFSNLAVALNKVKFDPEVDRLIAVGDLIDRGPQSHMVEIWLAEDWFFSVKGNHEMMLIDGVVMEADQRYAIHHANNGGEWFWNLSPYGGSSDEAYARRLRLASILNDLPVLIEVETDDGIVGIVHAEPISNNWAMDMEFVEKCPDLDNRHITKAMWSRTMLTMDYPVTVKGVHKVIVGHNVVKKPVVLGNVHFIDTGAGYGREFTLMQIQGGKNE